MKIEPVCHPFFLFTDTDSQLTTYTVTEQMLSTVTEWLTTLVTGSTGEMISADEDSSSTDVVGSTSMQGTVQRSFGL